MIEAVIRFLIRRFGEQRVIDAVQDATECKWYPSTNPVKARKQRSERTPEGHKTPNTAHRRRLDLLQQACTCEYDKPDPNCPVIP